MPAISITEYERLGEDSQGNIVLAGKEPALARQTKTFTADSAAGTSAAFTGSTHFIRIVTDTAGDYAAGPAPTAVVGDSALPANVIEVLSVHPGDKISII